MSHRPGVWRRRMTFIMRMRASPHLTTPYSLSLPRLSSSFSPRHPYLLLTTTPFATPSPPPELCRSNRAAFSHIQVVAHYVPAPWTPFQLLARRQIPPQDFMLVADRPPSTFSLEKPATRYVPPRPGSTVCAATADATLSYKGSSRVLPSVNVDVAARG